MSKNTLLSMVAVLLAGIVIGVVLGAAPSQAADDAPATTVQALTQASPVVSVVPYQSRTDYEQDPFETTRLRRTTTTVQRLVVVHADGAMEIKDAP